MTDIRLLALDIDGTILNHEYKLSERTEQTLKKALEKGIQIVLATGKTAASTTDLTQRLNLNTPLICLQGAAIYNANREITSQKTLSADHVRRALTFIEDRGFAAILYSGNRIMVRAFHAKVDYIVTSRHEPAPEVVGPLQNVLDEFPIHKVIAYKIGEGQTVASLRWQLNAQLSNAVNMVIVENNLEIIPQGVNKGAGLKIVMRDLKIAPEQVMAVGDDNNDIEMFQVAGISVAMGHAAQKVKDAAKFTTSSNAEDGLAEAIEKHVLNIQPPQPVIEPAVKVVPQEKTGE